MNLLLRAFRFRQVFLAAGTLALLSGCAWWSGAQKLGGAPDTAVPRDMQHSVEAARLAGEAGLDAILCARRFAETNWDRALPAEIGDASLTACAPQLARYAEAETVHHSAKIGLIHTKSADMAALRQTAVRWAGDALDRKRTEARSAAIRRALELRRSQ